MYNIAGATLSKGLNRGMGTILGGGLGCLAAALAQEVGGKFDHAIIVGIFVFIFGWLHKSFFSDQPYIGPYFVIFFMITFISF